MVTQQLDDLKAAGVISPVSEPTDWAATLVVVRKPNGKLRIYVYHTCLNRFVLRPTHPTRTPRDAVSKIDSEAIFYSCFEAANAYYHPDSQHLTTDDSVGPLPLSPSVHVP